MACRLLTIPWVRRLVSFVYIAVGAGWVILLVVARRLELDAVRALVASGSPFVLPWLWRIDRICCFRREAKDSAFLEIEFLLKVSEKCGRLMPDPTFGESPSAGRIVRRSRFQEATMWQQRFTGYSVLVPFLMSNKTPRVTVRGQRLDLITLYRARTSAGGRNLRM